MGLFPSSVLILSITAATSPRFVTTIGIGVLSSPSRAASLEKESSSNVKCSEIFMGLSVEPEFTHRVSFTTITSARQFSAAVLAGVFTSGAATQVIVPSVIVPTPATVGDCVQVGWVAPVVHVPEHDCTW